MQAHPLFHSEQKKFSPAVILKAVELEYALSFLRDTNISAGWIRDLESAILVAKSQAAQCNRDYVEEQVP